MACRSRAPSPIALGTFRLPGRQRGTHRPGGDGSVFARPISPLPESARTETATINVTLEPIPATLDPVISRAALDCPRTPASGQALALWEQARLGFLATVVARDAMPAQTRALSFRRYLHGTDVLDQFVEPRGRRHVRLWPVSSPEEFVTKGYVTTNAAGVRTYHEPDADVLLHDSFVANHCFALAPDDREHPRQVGITFGPGAPGGVHDSIVDVSGTLWLDRAPLALRSLEFRYENVDAASRRAGIGGSLAFRTAANGIVVIEQWQLRIPAVVAGASRGAPNPAGNVAIVRPPTADAPLLQVNGGELLSEKWPDRVAITRTLSTVQGTLTDRETGKPLPGISVGLANTPYRAVTAPNGSFTINDVLPGPYLLAAVDSGWVPFGLGRTVSGTVKVPESGPLRLRFQMASLPLALAARCTPGTTGKGSGALAGVVVDADGHM